MHSDDKLKDLEDPGDFGDFEGGDGDDDDKFIETFDQLLRLKSTFVG